MKGKSNKIISLCLILTMIVALCACGNSTDNNGGSNSKGNSKVTNSAAKENVYAMKEFNLNFEGENTEIATLSVVEDKVYIVATTYNWTEEGNNTKYFIYQCNLEGTVESEIELEMDSESTNGWLNILQISTDGTVYGIFKKLYFF